MELFADIDVGGNYEKLSTRYIDVSCDNPDIKFIGGKLAANGAAFENDVTVTVSAEVYISYNRYSDSAKVTITRGDNADGDEIDYFMYDAPEISEGAVTITAYNPETEEKTLYIIIADYSENVCTVKSINKITVGAGETNFAETYEIESYTGNGRVFVFAF